MIFRPARDPLGPRVTLAAKPVVAAIQGVAIGGGFGLSLVADFRVVAPQGWFAANFVRLGIHPGFGLTHTLPRLIGIQKASLMFYTGRRINGEEAVRWGLADVMATAERLRREAKNLATEIAEQNLLFPTEDHKEGVLAVREKRRGDLHGR